MIRIVAWLVAFLFPVVAAAAGQVIDTKTMAIPGDNEWRAVATQPDGQFVAAGYAFFGPKQFTLARYTTTGPLDPSFGNAGIAHAGIDGADVEAIAMVRQPDGRFLVVGNSYGSRGRMAIARFNVDGSLDSTFRGNGIFHVGADSVGDSGAYAVALAPNGQFYVGGYSNGSGVNRMVVLRFNADGSLDTTYNGGVSTASTDPAGAVIHSIELQPDGMLIFAGDIGNADHARVGRLDANGILDPVFGVKDIPNFWGAWDIALQSDGKVIVAGTMLRTDNTSTGPFKQVAVIRLLPATGDLDTSFGRFGTGYAPFEGRGGNAGNGARASAVAIQANGGIVVATGGDPGVTNQRGSAAALDANGREYNGFFFGVSGIPGWGRSFYAMAQFDDGHLALAGYDLLPDADGMVTKLDSNGTFTFTFNFVRGEGGLPESTDAGSAHVEIAGAGAQDDGSIVFGGRLVDNDIAFVARMKPDGTRDTGFDCCSAKGVVRYPAGVKLNTVTVQDDGTIYVGGSSLGTNGQQGWWYDKLYPDGRLTGIGNQGNTKLLTQNGGAITSLVVRADGTIIAGGWINSSPTFKSAAFGRFTPNGQPDAGFNNGAGYILVPMSDRDSVIQQIVLQPDASVVGAGWAEVTATQDSFALARVTYNGARDTSFGNNGVAIYNFGSQSSHANSVALQPDGKIIAGGSVNGTTEDFGLIRVFPGGALDPPFGASGRVQSDFGGDDIIHSLTLLSNGKILAVGESAGAFASALYLSNGQRDPTYGSAGGVMSVSVSGKYNDRAMRGMVLPDTTIVMAGTADIDPGIARISGDATASRMDASFTVSVSQDPSNQGQPITFTANVSGNAGTATGTVTFVEGSTPIEGCSSLPLSGGNASCTTASLSVGKHTITVNYSGDDTYNPGSFTMFPVTVQPAPSSETNWALASNGGIPSASTQYSADFPFTAINNGERTGANWTHGGGWADGTIDTYPDWAQVEFNGPKKIDMVVVYTLQDNWQNPVQPSDTMTFTQYGIVDFTVQGWDGAQWQVLATVTGNNLVKRTVTFPAFNTTKIRVNVTRALGSLSRITELEAYGVPGDPLTPPSSVNVALASIGATATASSQYGADFPVSALIDGDETGANWTHGGGWADATVDQYPDWVQVNFNGLRTINHVTVVTLQDNWQSPSQPTDTMTFTQYGIVDFTVQGWNGSSWVDLGSVTNNNLVKRDVAFPAFQTDRVRVVITRALAGLSRITELEAWTTQDPPVARETNYALASWGTIASASSSFGPGYPVSAINDDERAGRNWSAGGGWADATQDQYPDWVQLDFGSARTIDRVVLYTLQDDWQNPVEPTTTMTFTQYGITAFDVQGWDGSQWVTLASVTGNQSVMRTVTFSAFTTSKLRVSVNNSLNHLSRITEVQAWGPPAQPGQTNVALATTGEGRSPRAVTGPITRRTPSSTVTARARTGAPAAAGPTARRTPTPTGSRSTSTQPGR